jgi:hypothetical protein
MDIGTVIEGIQTVLLDKRQARGWVNKFCESMTPNDLEHAVKTGFDPVTAIINEYSLADPNVRKFAVLVVRRYWKDISAELKSVPKIIARLATNPANAEQLKKPETIQYLNTNCIRAYDIFYLYAWPPNVDLKCAHCGTVFPFDIMLCRAMSLNSRQKVFGCPGCGKLVEAAV